MDIKDEDFKIGLLKEYLKRRNNKLNSLSEKELNIKKQKFILFYNLMAKNNEKPYTLKNLQALKEGLVYYDIDKYIKMREKLVEEKIISKQEYSNDILNAVSNLVESESAESLSKLTEALDLWMDNYKLNLHNNEITSKDITSKDKNIIEILYEYNLNLYNNYELEKINNKICAVEKKNKEKIMEIINSENPYIEDVFNELLQIDGLAKINYSEEHKDDELGGITIDI